MIAFPERPLPVASLRTFRSFARGASPRAVRPPPCQPNPDAQRRNRAQHLTPSGCSRARKFGRPSPSGTEGCLWVPPSSTTRRHLRRSHLPLRPARQPIQGDGGGPGLFSGIERLAGERLEVLAEAAFGDLLEG